MKPRHMLVIGCFLRKRRKRTWMDVAVTENDISSKNKKVGETVANQLEIQN